MSEWPSALRAWVTQCLGQMNDSNKADATEEMKKVISEHTIAGDMWTFDWSTVKLQSLEPKIGTKRKFLQDPANSKKSKKSGKSLASVDPSDEVAKAKRLRRFEREHDLERQRNRGGGIGFVVDSQSQYGTSQITSGVKHMTLDPVWDGDLSNTQAIIGRSQNIFKDYLRLTSEPNPDNIRPPHVLSLTLKELKRIWRERNDYKHINNQFKSLRQDLVVQRVKTEFTVQVYEIHARMALEAGDMVEFGTCQSMLKDLYALGLPGNVHEFLAYRILSMVHGRNRSELNVLVGQLTDAQKSVPAVQHALDVVKALSRSNYYGFFRLYVSAPNMGGYIMDHFAEEKRVQALMTMCKSYNAIPLTFIMQHLGYDSVQEVLKSLETHNASVFKVPNAPIAEKALDPKAAAPRLAASFEEKYRKVGIKGRV